MKRRFIVFGLGLAATFGACRKDVQTLNHQDNPNVVSTKMGDSTMHKLMIDGKATYVNEVGSDYYLADDLTINPEQFSLLKRFSNSNATERSTIMKDFIQTWPDGVVYYQSLAGFSQERQASVRKAMQMITSGTSIKFVERTNQPEYIYFVNSNVNSSPLGWWPGRVNRVNIYNWNYPGIVAHEIMHSLGVMHEQCRPDRDQYVRINFNKVASGTEHNFSTSSYVSGYGEFDFNSVMMYGATSFSIDGTPTITRLDGSTYSTQRNGPSEGDYKGLNHLYSPVKTSGGLLAEGVYRISPNADANKFFDFLTGNGRTTEGSQILLYTSLSDDSQKFIFRKSGNHGYFVIKSVVDTTQVLTVQDGSTSTGTPVELRRLSNQSSQKWRLYNLGNKGFAFAPANAPSLRLEVRGGASANYTPIVLGFVNDTNPKQNFMVNVSK